jgi:CheY-like chemotaxis protein
VLLVPASEPGRIGTAHRAEAVLMDLHLPGMDVSPEELIDGIRIVHRGEATVAPKAVIVAYEAGLVIPGDHGP